MSSDSKKNVPSDQESMRNAANTSKDALVLHNDDIHSFDYVIESLMEVCKHDLIQATQCTFLVHYKGCCHVKLGLKEELFAMRNALRARGLKVTVFSGNHG